MGIREYGRHRGVSHVAVLKAVRAGRIRRNRAGLIDSDAADRDWARNTHPAPRAPRAVPVIVADYGGFARARTVRAHFEALLAKLEYERRSAELLDADEVQVASYRVGQAFREHMLRIPDAVIRRLREDIGRHAAAPDEGMVHAILIAEIRTALLAFCEQMESG
jgi:phage terminase Nu1 subunit (DNA packaging protein)